MREIIDELRKLNYNISEIHEVMKMSQKNKFMQVFDAVGAIVAILGLVAIVDIIRNWILGG
jgi:hypothetical protein